MPADSTGNIHTLAALLGASNHTSDRRADKDYYATDPAAVEPLFAREKFAGTIWEPAAGGGHLAEVARKYNPIYCSDITCRGYTRLDACLDFLATVRLPGAPREPIRSIITNPPYSKAAEFAWHACELLEGDTDAKVALFLKIQFLEGQKRRKLFRRFPPRTVYVFSARQLCGKNGVFTGVQPAMCYCWFVWEIGFSGDPCIRWI